VQSTKWRVEVEEVSDVDQPALVEDQALEIDLEEGVRALLELDHAVAVGEGGGVAALR